MTNIQQKPVGLRAELKKKIKKITAAVVPKSWEHLEKLAGNKHNVSPFVWRLFGEVGCKLRKT